MRCIYVIKNLINGKTYVGQTKNFANRKAGHLYNSRKGNERPLYKSIRKHGEENFLFEVVENGISLELINEREKFWVSHYDSFNPEKGYNLTSGGSRGTEISEETRRKNRKGALITNEKIWNDQEFRQRHKQRCSNLFKRLHKEGRIKSHDRSGEKHRQETKDKIGKANSISQKGEKNSQYGTCWIYHSIEMKNLKIKKEELESYVLLGWVRGRKLNKNH